MTRGTLALGTSPEDLRRAAEILRAGGLVAFPTETVYGLGARADDADAVRSIFAAKGRPSENPLIAHLPDVDTARRAAARWPDAAEALADAFWPGPLTLVVERRRGAGEIVDEATASGPTVALRVPEHPVARALLREVALPIAAPSANRSTSISPTTAAHVAKTLDGRIDAIVDGGPTGFGIESAIVDVTGDVPVLLRRGALSRERLAAVTPIVDRGARVIADGGAPNAPGAYARHYAPDAEVRIVAPGEVAFVVALLAARGVRVGSIERSSSSAGSSAGASELGRVLSEDPVAFATDLYAAFHALEDARCAVIVVAAPPDGVDWDAVRDRIARASAP